MRDDPDRPAADPPPVPRSSFAHGVITGRMLTVLLVSLVGAMITLALVYAHFAQW